MGRLTQYQLLEFDSASLTGSYQNFGSVLSNPCYELTITNDSDVHVYVSIDGSADTWRIGDGQSLTLRGTSRSFKFEDSAYLIDKSTQLQIKQVTGSGTGFVFANLSLVS